MTSIELRVLIRSSDDRDQAADRIKTEVRRALAHVFPPESLYVDRVTTHASKR